MNLKEGKGKVPIWKIDGWTHTYKLVEMPDRETFDTLYVRHTPEQRDKIWSIVMMRLKGEKLRPIAAAHGVSPERVRQIESHFQRRLSALLSESF